MRSVPGASAVRALGVLLAILAACHGGSKLSPDAGLPADAMPDGSTPVVQFSGCGVTDAARFTLPAVRVGQVVSYTFPFSPSQGRLGPLASSSDPELAATTDSTSEGLKVTFTPTAPGHREIEVTVAVRDRTPQPTAVGTLTIAVDVLPASPSPLVATSPLVLAAPFMNRVLLQNRSASTPIELYTTTVTTDDGSPPVGSANLARCPRTLQPGDSCLVEFEPTQRTPGCSRTAVTFHSSANDETVYIDTRRGSISVNLSSPLGTLTASPPGSCSASECFATPVTLTATPTAGGRFVGWTIDSGCSTDPTCVFRPPAIASPLYSAIARFAPATAKAVTLTIQGSGKGRVLVYEQEGAPVVCEGSCTYASAGEVRLVAAAGSRFTGWTGACSGAIPQCNLGVLAGDVVVGATFDPDDRELAVLALLPFDLYVNGSAVGGGFLPGGDVVIAAASRISRMTSAGSVVWTRPGDASNLVTGLAGEIYYLGWSGMTPLLYKRDPAGTVVWSRALYYPHNAAPYSAYISLAVTASGDLAVLGEQTLRVVAAATGADVWTAPAGYGAMAANPAGGLVVAVGDPGDSHAIRIQRYSAAGARQLPDWILTDGGYASLAFDPQGFLVTRIWNQSTGIATLRRISATGTTVLSSTEPSVRPSAVRRGGERRDRDGRGAAGRRHAAAAPERGRGRHLDARQAGVHEHARARDRRDRDPARHRRRGACPRDRGPAHRGDAVAGALLRRPLGRAVRGALRPEIGARRTAAPPVSGRCCTIPP